MERHVARAAFLVVFLGLLSQRENRAAAAEAKAAPRIVCDRVVEDFSSTPAGAFPVGWRTRDADEMPEAKQRGLYVVEEREGRKVLHAKYRERAITIGKKIPSWNLEQYPFLEWEWRVEVLPERGNERDSSTNDSAAGVYVIWDVGFPFHVDGIKYAWSTTLPTGSRLSRRLGHDQLLVMESGRDHRATWRKVRVDVRDHHARFFGRETPRSPDGIALLTDADATSSAAEAYYANFRLCRTAPVISP
ncbi:MAG TPA: DUF3047 domain-containing protein [Polyangiaceae bacterium]